MNRLLSPRPDGQMPAHAFDCRRPDGGFALVTVLWVVVMAGLMLLAAQKAARVTMTTAYNELASVQAHWIARAGVERAMAILEDDGRAVDGRLDDWYSNSRAFEAVELAGGAFFVTAPSGDLEDVRKPRFGLTDMAGRLNLNVADEAQLKALGDLMAAQQADSILDWRDADDQARPGGAEGTYYLRLRHPYLIRNGPLQTVREVMLMQGIDELTFAGEDANDNGVLDENENDMAASYPPDDGDGQLRPGLAGLCTVYSYEPNVDAAGGKRTNLSTADKNTLMQKLNFSDGLAEAVTKRTAAKPTDKSDGSGGPPSGDGARPRTEDGKSEGDGAGGGKAEKPAASRFNSLFELPEVKEEKGTGTDSGGGAGKLSKVDVKWLAEHWDELTLSDDERLPARVNVNTAPRQVLLSLPKMDEATADGIIRHRQSGRGPFNGVGDLYTAGVITEEQFKAMAERITVRGNVFEVRSSAVTTWGIRQEIVAVVDRGAKPMKVLYWYQSE